MPYPTHMAKTHIPRALVLAVRIQYEAGYTILELRLAYGYSRQTVSDLVHYKTHKRVRLGPNESRDVPPLPRQDSTSPPQPRQGAHTGSTGAGTQQDYPQGRARPLDTAPFLEPCCLGDHSLSH